MKYRLIDNKKYHMWDFFLIPLRICPFLTIVKTANQILCGLTSSAELLLTAKFIDTALAVFNGQAQLKEIYLPLILIGLLVAYQLLNWSAIRLILEKMEMRLNREYRSAIVEKRAKLEYCHIENNDTWDLISRTCDQSVRQIMNGFDNLLSMAQLLVNMGSMMLIVMTQVWWIGLLIIAVSVPLFAVAIKGGKETYKANKEAQKYTRRSDYLREVLQRREYVEERSLFGYTDRVNDDWYEKFETARKINLKMDLKWFVRYKSLAITNTLLSVAIMAALLVPLSQNTVSVGMFFSLSNTTSNLIVILSGHLTYIIGRLTNAREYLKDLNAFCALSETEGALDQPVRQGEVSFERIEFKDVWFRYPGTETYILKGFNLVLEKNRHYAFVGINGAGKTTVTKLLTGIYDQFEGEILINGTSIREYTQAQLKAFFAVVYQDFARYYLSMEENIALGDVNEKKPEEIRQAASVIGLDEAISKLPEGISTPLGKIEEDSLDLSGGEWQRVAIARALYNPAEIRILDEPTAALDPVAESEIYEMFGRISAGKSTIFITHRLGAAKLANEIIVIDDGKVAEKGSHSQLLEQNGIYAEMFEAQRSWYQ